eukprot:SAG31_NODE_2763_length_5128_cov_25.339232_8_plen_48_part_01
MKRTPPQKKKGGGGGGGGGGRTHKERDNNISKGCLCVFKNMNQRGSFF